MSGKIVLESCFRVMVLLRRPFVGEEGEEREVSDVSRNSVERRSVVRDSSPVIRSLSSRVVKG